MVWNRQILTEEEMLRRKLERTEQRVQSDAVWNRAYLFIFVFIPVVAGLVLAAIKYW